MGFLQHILNFYIKASIHVALAVCAFTLATFLEFNLEVHYELLAFTFFGTILGYNFVKVKGANSITNDKVVPSRVSQWASTISFFATGYFLLFIPVRSLLIIGFLGILTLLYVLPIFKNKNLRSLSGLKIFIVGIVWAGVTVIVPWYTSEMDPTLDVGLSFLQRFLWVIALTIPFEIRDVTIDDSSLYTIPQVLGIRNAKALGILFLVMVAVLEGFKGTIVATAFFSLIFGLLVSLGYLIKSKKKQKELFASFWVEAIPIWYAFVFYVLTYYCPNC